MQKRPLKEKGNIWKLYSLQGEKETHFKTVFNILFLYRKNIGVKGGSLQLMKDKQK